MTYPNWFTPYAQGFFERHLSQLAGEPDLRFLQIGAFTGDASSWLLQHILTGPGSTLTDVDTWAGSDEPEHEAFDWADVERVYDERTRGFVKTGRLRKFKGTSSDFFVHAHGRYDFIYIDGDHTLNAVRADGFAAVKRLKPDGWIAFDDYLWTPHGGGDGPRKAIDGLNSGWTGVQLKEIEFGAQAWFRAMP